MVEFRYSVLTSLAKGPQHYGSIMHDVAVTMGKSKPEVKRRLYVEINRFCANGIALRLKEASESPTYSLTEIGLEILESERAHRNLNLGTLNE